MTYAQLKPLLLALAEVGIEVDTLEEAKAVERATWELKPIVTKFSPGLWDEIWIFFGLCTDDVKGAKAQARHYLNTVLVPVIESEE